MNYISSIKIKYNNNNNNNQKYSFNFLDILEDYIDKKEYYNYLNTLSFRQIKNIYKIIYIKWLQIFKKDNIYKINNNELDIYIINDNINNFINIKHPEISCICKAIFVLNIICNS